MRTRFPPSPTGMLHVGGLRTALFNYLLAKQTGGEFIVRIEDTDQERTVEGAVKNILETLQWAGLIPDEGVMLKNKEIAQKGNKGPYVQSERLEIYKNHVQRLLESGHAYYAFDTPEELSRMREEERKTGNTAPKYDLSVRMRMRNSLTMPEEEVALAITKQTPYVIRLKIPENRTFTADDAIRGKVEFKSHTVDDTVLIKSDGFPTYHLANVVDDHLMEIDLVLRGEEWLPSLPKHLLLYEAFGWKPPTFAHVPLLLNKGGGKLSKRQGDVSVSDYIEKGYLPEAMINFLALLGWNPGGTKEIFSLEELVEEFSLRRVQKGGAVFDTEKLDWLQGQWIRRITPEEFAERLHPIIAQKFAAAEDDIDFVKKAALIQERITFFKEAPEMLSYFYEEPMVTMELLAEKKQKLTPDAVLKIVHLLLEILEPMEDWSEESLQNILFTACDERELTKGQLLWPLRAALTGLPYSPGAFEVAAALGKEETLHRLRKVEETSDHAL